MKVDSIKYYVTHPHLLFGRLSLAIHEFKHPDEPWLSQGSVRWLDSNLTNKMTMLEWGSGRSTLWFANRVGKITSIEYNQDWFNKVKHDLEMQHKSNVDLRYIPLEHPLKAPTPKHYDTTPKYVDVIAEFGKESLDVVLIDGHYRLTCADKCLDYIKPGGYLVIDNSNRVSYEEWGVPSNWQIMHESENVKTQTTIWQKS